MEPHDNLLSDEDKSIPMVFKDVSDQLNLSLHLNFVAEILLSLSSEQLAYFFLVFDC
jgi:hypothetical protein